MFFTLVIIQGFVELSLLTLCVPCLAAVSRNLKMVIFQNGLCSLPQIPRGKWWLGGVWEEKESKRKKRKRERKEKQRIKKGGRKEEEREGRNTREKRRTILPVQEQYFDLSENSM